MVIWPRWLKISLLVALAVLSFAVGRMWATWPTPQEWQELMLFLNGESGGYQERKAKLLEANKWKKESLFYHYFVL